MVSEKQKFKVGDRVRFKTENHEYLAKHSYGGLKIIRIASNANRNGTVDVDVRYDDEHADYYQTCTLSDLEQVPPSVLTIQTGKFYKTHDGRKVGPLVWNTIVDGWIVELGDGSAWNRDGTVRDLALIHSDLVAEWIEEPAIPVAPVKPKFKVGDKVISNHGKGERIATVVAVVDANDFTVSWDDGGYGSTHRWMASELSLAPTPTAIVALIENGKLRPSSRPKVHTDQDSAAKEAERLALLYPGQEFGVFVLADSKIADTITETVTRTVLRAA